MIEVGLGGRFDATNVVEGAVNVIAPVDYDHAEFLGTELSGIAREKAGSPSPAGRWWSPTSRRSRWRRSRRRRTGSARPLLLAGRDWDAWSERGRLAVSWRRRPARPARARRSPARTRSPTRGWRSPRCGAWGDPRIDEAAIAHGVASAVWPARLQRLTAGPLAERAAARGADLWLDGGHNPHAARALADFARALTARDGRPVTLVMGVLARKDVDGMMAALRARACRLVSVGFEAEAAAPPQALADAAARHGLPAADRARRVGGAGARAGGEGARAACGDRGLAVPGRRGAGDEPADLAGLTRPRADRMAQLQSNPCSRKRSARAQCSATPRAMAPSSSTMRVLWSGGRRAGPRPRAPRRGSSSRRAPPPARS